jgi:RNA polymerase sigma-70 factor (ECF subfamily)
MSELTKAQPTFVIACPIDDIDAVDQFVVQFRNMAYRTAIRIVVHPEIAEDVTQDALIRAFRSWDRLSKVEYQVAWVRKTVVRCALTALQSCKTESTILDIESIDSEEQSVAVRAILANLEPNDRAILGLVVGEGLSYAEVAEILEIRIGTVASRLNRAKAAFRVAWEGSNED